MSYKFKVFKRRKDWCHGCGQTKEDLVEIIVEDDNPSYIRLCRGCIHIVVLVRAGSADYEQEIG